MRLKKKIKCVKDFQIQLHLKSEKGFTYVDLDVIVVAADYPVFYAIHDDNGTLLEKGSLSPYAFYDYHALNNKTHVLRLNQSAVATYLQASSVAALAQEIDRSHDASMSRLLPESMWASEYVFSTMYGTFYPLRHILSFVMPTVDIQNLTITGGTDNFTWIRNWTLIVDTSYSWCSVRLWTTSVEFYTLTNTAGNRFSAHYVSGASVPGIGNKEGNSFVILPVYPEDDYKPNGKF